MTQPLLLAVSDSDIALVADGGAMEPAADKEAQARCDKNAEQKMRGDIAELLFCLGARQRGYRFKLLGSNCEGYDVILERASMRPMFVQVKHGLLKEQLKGASISRNYFIQNNKQGRLYSQTAYDVLAFYMWERNEWLFYTREELGNRTATCWTPPELSSRPSPSYAPEFRAPNNWHLLDEVAESLTANRETSLTPKTTNVPPLPVQMST
jgi:hypothetical protein